MAKSIISKVLSEEHKRQSNLRKLQSKLHEVLNLIKDIQVGYSSNTPDKMFIEYNNSRYILSIKAVPTLLDFQEEMEICLKEDE